MYKFAVFFKQKTAYEIPKRDWSSDVCSSDLHSSRPSRWTRKVEHSNEHRCRHRCRRDSVGGGKEAVGSEVAHGSGAVATNDHLRIKVSHLRSRGRDHLSRRSSGRESVSWSSRSRRLQCGHAVQPVIDVAAERGRDPSVSACYG